MSRQVHPIETDSYRILREHVDTAHLPRLCRAVVERVVHATADPAYVDDLVCDEPSLARGVAALTADAPIVADVAMVAAGITARDVRTYITDERATELAHRTDTTRSAAAVRVGADEVGPGAVWVIGCAPTALVALLEVDADPALVVGLPVGFVGAARSKAALRDSGLPALSNRSPKGGSAAAAAAVNALLYEGTDP